MSYYVVYILHVFSSMHGMLHDFCMFTVVSTKIVHAIYCRSGNIRENLIFANIREMVASQFKVFANKESL